MKKIKTKISKKHQKNSQPKTQPFIAHIQELRSKILVCIGVFLFFTLIGYLFNDKILYVLLKPINQPIFYVSPVGGLDFILKTSLFFGLLLSFPFFIYNIFKFIQPALPEKYPNILSTAIISSCLLLVAGVSFAYFVSLPATLYFFSKFSSENVQALISTTEYFNFVFRYLIGFGFIFQLPLVILAINVFKKVSLFEFVKFERWIIVISFVFAAILTPTPDFFNQSIMAFPLIILYQLTGILLFFVNRKKK